MQIICEKIFLKISCKKIKNNIYFLQLKKKTGDKVMKLMNRRNVETVEREREREREPIFIKHAFLQK